MMGSKHTLPLMPDPAKVKLWLHLGASIGTRQWVSWQTIFFHTPDDKPGVNSAELLAPYGVGVEKLLQSIQP